MNKEFKKALFVCALTAPMILLSSCTQQATAESKTDQTSCTTNEIENKKTCEKQSNENVMRTGSENFIFAADKEWEPAGEGCTRQVMGYDGQIMMVKVKFEKGGVGALHSHYHSQVTYVESGKFEFTIKGEKKIVTAGDVLYKEPDAVHGCVCLEAGMLIDCFSPMRENFIKK